MELLTVEEAATILKLSAFTIRRLLKSGQLRGVKIGGRQWRIRASDLELYINGKG